MKFGFFMMPLHHHTENPTLAFERDLQLIEYAESLGFDEFWVGEHHTGGWETVPAPDIFLAAAATRTKRIRLGTAVINLPYHHPFHVAERMAFLDHLAYGRIMLGCGPGVLPPDIKLFGLEQPKLRPMMNESLDIILKLYREEGPVSYEGEFWTIKDMEIQVKPYQQPHLPIFMVSSGSGNSIRMAGERGVGLISGLNNNVMNPSQQWQAYEDLATQNGHQVSRQEWRLSTSIYLAESMEEARNDVADGILTNAQQYGWNLGARPSNDELTGQQLIDQRRAIIGDPDYCIRRIKEHEEATGGFGSLLLTVMEWTSTQKWQRSLELFARYVIPQFNGSLRGIQSSYDRMVEDNRLGRLPPLGAGPVDGGTGSSP